MSDRELKRISLMIGEDQYDTIAKRSLNLSWLVRDLLDDYLKDQRITFQVSKETLSLFERISASTPMDDTEFEPFLRQALHAYLKHQIQRMQSLDKDLSKKKD